MSRSTIRSARPLARPALLLVAAASAVALVSGCSAGQITQTATKEPSVPGVNVDVGTIGIRNAIVIYPPTGAWDVGATVPLQMRLVNTGSEADTLARYAVDPEFAESVELDTAPASPSGTPSPSGSGHASPSGSTSPSGTATPSAPATSVTPSATPTGSAAPGQQGRTVAVPPATVVALDPSGQHLALVKLKKKLFTGDEVEVTLTFEKAGEVTLTLPVAPPPSPLPRPTLSEEHAGGEEGAEEGTESHD